MNVPLLCRAVLFDLDGTLVESAPDLWRATNHVLKVRGRPELPLNLVRDFVGNGARYLLARGLWGVAAVPPEGDPEFEEAVTLFLDYYRKHITDHSFPFPGVVDTLQRLQERGFAMAVVTNKPEYLTHAMLENLDLSKFFPVVVGGDTLTERKPHPLPMQHAMQRLSALPANTVMVGDSEPDALAAKNAGCRLFLVSYGYNRGQPLDELQPDATMDHFDQLLELLAPLQD